MSTNTDAGDRKDRIIVDETLIGREIFFNRYICEDSVRLDFTPNRMYKVIGRTSGLLYIFDDVGCQRVAPINTPALALDSIGTWKLAKRTSSAQSVVRTENGRKL